MALGKEATDVICTYVNALDEPSLYWIGADKDDLLFRILSKRSSLSAPIRVLSSNQGFVQGIHRSTKHIGCLFAGSFTRQLKAPSRECTEPPASIENGGDWFGLVWFGMVMLPVLQ